MNVNLIAKDGQLLIEGDIVNEWSHRLFFEVVLGCSIDEINSNFKLDIDEKIFSNIREIISYLEDEQISYTANSELKFYINILENEEVDYFNALENSLSPEPINIPSSIQRKLYPFQREAFSHLISVRNGANFSVPGSGKTTVIYTAFEYFRKNSIVEKLFVIGPVSSFFPWQDEGEKCLGKPITIGRLMGSKNQREIIYSDADNFEIFLTTYQTASNDLSEIISLFTKFGFFLVIDESHNIKRFKDGVWSDAALKLSRFAKRRAILSGTPMPNGLVDLWTQFTFLWPGEFVLGNRYSYEAMIGKNENIELVRKKVSPLIHRVIKSELGLPEPNFEIIKCSMSPYQTKIYESLAVRFLNQLNLAPQEKSYLRDWRRAKLIRLIQIASNPSLLISHSLEFDIPPLSGEDASIIDLIEDYSKYEKPGKFIKLLSLVEKLTSRGEKVIIWTSFVQNIQMLELLLYSHEIYKIYGAIAKYENENIELNREQQIRDFKESKNPAILIANPAACAESISLQKVCKNAIYLDRTFNAGQYLQSLDRIHRLGLEQDDIVNYHVLISDTTIDETIQRRLIEKERKMIDLLDGDFPTGDFILEMHQMAATEEEEIQDFNETVKDIKSSLSFE